MSDNYVYQIMTIGIKNVTWPCALWNLVNCFSLILQTVVQRAAEKLSY